MKAAIKYVEFSCRKCNATDVVKLYQDEPIPPAVNCHGCKAGRGVELGQMVEAGIGMFPSREIPESEYVSPMMPRPVAVPAVA